jgi:acyl carrier protein
MSFGIYFLLYHIIGKALKAFRIGVDRKANLLASQVLTVFSVDAVEVLVSCAITGQFRFFPDFLWRYVLLALVQSILLCLLVIPLVDLYRHFFKAHQILEVYHEASYEKLHFMNDRPDKFHIKDIININEGLDKIFDKMEEIFTDIMDLKDIKLNDETSADDIEEWDSLSHIQIIVAIEKAFGIKFSSQEMITWKNVGDMVDCIQNKI